MATMYNKGADYAVLKSLGVDSSNLQVLKSAGVNLSVGTDIIRLTQGQEKLDLSFGSLGVSNAVKNPKATIKVTTDTGLSAYISADIAVNNFVSKFISNIVDDAASSITNLGVIGPDSPESFTNKPKKIYHDPTADVPIPPSHEVTSANNYSSLPAVKLRDATVLYQRVEGTDSSSVYRLVAANDKVKMAVRVKSGGTLSVRLEGTIDSTVESKLIGYGLSKKNAGHYSGHFDCTACSPESFIGAIIVGSGIRFTTPIPDYSKVSK